MPTNSAQKRPWPFLFLSLCVVLDFKNVLFYSAEMAQWTLYGCSCLRCSSKRDRDGCSIQGNEWRVLDLNKGEQKSRALQEDYHSREKITFYMCTAFVIPRDPNVFHQLYTFTAQGSIALPWVIIYTVQSGGKMSNSEWWGFTHILYSLCTGVNEHTRCKAMEKNQALGTKLAPL